MARAVGRGAVSTPQRREALFKQCGNLICLSERALELALEGNLLGFKETIDRRGRIIEEIKTSGELRGLSEDAREAVRDGFLAVRRIDQEITRCLRCEMQRNKDETAALVSKKKVLSAYDKIVPKTRRFDKLK